MRVATIFFVLSIFLSLSSSCSPKKRINNPFLGKWVQSDDNLNLVGELNKYTVIKAEFKDNFEYSWRVVDQDGMEVSATTGVYYYRLNVSQIVIKEDKNGAKEQTFSFLFTTRDLRHLGLTRVFQLIMEDYKIVNFRKE